MGNKRKISSAKPQFGNNVPFSIKKTRRKFKPNMQTKRIFSPALGRMVRVRVSVSELRTIDKIGIDAFAKRQGVSLKNLVSE